MKLKRVTFSSARSPNAAHDSHLCTCRPEVLHVWGHSRLDRARTGFESIDGFARTRWAGGLDRGMGNVALAMSALRRVGLRRPGRDCRSTHRTARVGG